MFSSSHYLIPYTIISSSRVSLLSLTSDLPFRGIPELQLASKSKRCESRYFAYVLQKHLPKILYPDPLLRLTRWVVPCFIKSLVYLFLSALIAS